MKKGATSYKETALGIIPREKLLKLEMEGTKRGLEHIYSLIKKKQNLSISPKYILKLHEVSFGWIFPDWAGKFRTIQVTFSGQEAVPYFNVPQLIKNLCDDLQERIKHLPKINSNEFIVEVVKLLAWWQHGFVLIHPFKDYNGRMARMLTGQILLQLDLPPMEIKAETGRDRKIYIKAMQAADKGDYSILERLIGQAITENLKK